MPVKLTSNGVTGLTECAAPLSAADGSGVTVQAEFE
jgi:hypothetical protein